MSKFKMLSNIVDVIIFYINLRSHINSPESSSHAPLQCVMAYETNGNFTLFSGLCRLTFKATYLRNLAQGIQIHRWPVDTQLCFSPQWAINAESVSILWWRHFLPTYVRQIMWAASCSRPRKITIHMNAFIIRRQWFVTYTLSNM